ncbi:MAG: TatD family deoxyribonuclease [Dehalococcoidia bacterium]|nr:MAG: TatD family deoxyribonuclease [Dehalococcoidia bacterium]
MVYADSHAHMIDYEPDQVKAIIGLMRKKEVELVLAVGVNLESSEGTVKLAETYSEIKAAIGFHPWFAGKLNESTMQRFEKLASSKYVRAIGEVGLDYAPPSGPGAGPPSPDMRKMDFPKNMPPMPKTPPTHEVQKELFNYEVSIAQKYGLPLNIHCMGGAHQDMMQILKANPGVTGMAHSFEGDLKMLRDWLDLGFYIVLGEKQVIKEPLADLEKIIRTMPLDKMIVETDANPMHSPNGPVDVIPVVERIAAIRGATVQEVGNATTANLKRVLKL